MLIIITDNVRTRMIYSQFSVSIVQLLSIINLVRFINKGDSFALKFGLLLGLYALLFFIFLQFKSVKSEISFEEVKSIKIKRLFFNEFLHIKLKYNRIRQVAGIYNTYRLEEYIKTISLPK
jgi:hypothetical protein